jgi:hypothetical protein
MLTALQETMPLRSENGILQADFLAFAVSSAVSAQQETPQASSQAA